MPVLPTCVLCDHQNESVEHLFFEFPFVQYLWDRLLCCGQRLLPLHSPLNHWMIIERAIGWKEDVRNYFFFVLKKLLKVIWAERNKRVFDGKCCSKELVWVIVKNEIKKGMHDSKHCFHASQFEPWIP
jgi:hypothetical protein